MKLHWLLPGTVLTIFMLSLPAHAAKLRFWRFDALQNQLEIYTEGEVQPKAQLISNPTRLVIDLPGTSSGRPQISPSASSMFRSIRVAQLDEQTTRIIVDINPGYTLDPQQVKFEQATAFFWRVKLPKPQQEKVTLLPPNNIENRRSDGDDNTQPALSRIANTTEGVTQVENLRVTEDGFFMTTSGSHPQVKVDRSRDGITYMDISNARLSSDLAQRDLPINQYGVKHIQFTQLETQPPVVRIALFLDKDSPDWEASTSSQGGLVILPNRLSGKLPTNNTDSRFPTPLNSLTSELSTIQSVELADRDSQLVIRGDRNLEASGEWDSSKPGLFRITIANSQLAASPKGPLFHSDSPILRIRLQQQDPHTVVIFVQPAAGVQIRSFNQSNRTSVALKLRRTAMFTPPVDLPTLPGKMTNYPQPLTPHIYHGRAVAIIDPGHGGKDSGAVGIGAIQEKNIVLPIGIRVAQILLQNGVQVQLTRNADYFVDLGPRVEMAQRVHADVFVSVHANSAGAGRPDVSGLEVYYFDSGLGLARVVHDTILQNVNVRDRGIRQARFFVLRKSSMPSILVETGYMTGREDAAKLQTPEYQNQMAEAIARGVLQYLNLR